MKILKIKNFELDIKASFFVLLFIMIALDFIEQFFIIFVSVTLHELSHIFAAKMFGLKTQKVFITPVGEIAVINNMDTISQVKRNLIVLAGPFINIVIATLAGISTNGNIILLKNINISLAIFNLLPVYPLDGGRLLRSVLNSNIGTLSANKVSMKVSSISSFILFLLGIVQIILFPYNISLICIGLYLVKVNKKEYMHMTFEFYKSIINKNKRNKRIIPVKTFLTNKEDEIKNIIFRLCWDYYVVIYIYDNNIIKWTMTEDDLINYIQVNGLRGTINDVILDKEYVNFYN